MNLLQYRMVDPAHGALEESYTPDDDRQEVHSVFSEEGTGRRLDLGVIAKHSFQIHQKSRRRKKILTWNLCNHLISDEETGFTYSHAL